MAGLIREEDIAEVRDRARIDDVISSYVTLKRAGGGSLKGLCPFHDEKSPSFNVTPARGFFHCFGCGEGGDAITFLMKIDALTFSEAVERLADKYNVDLRREESPGQQGRAPERPRGPQRKRLIEAHRVTEEFYREQLGSPEAIVARRFLAERGFDQAAAEHFGIGYSPRDGEALTRHLRSRRFSDEETIASGLLAQGRTVYDRFRGRLMWPIREPGGDPIGFGARKLHDDDKISAKYLNTPETTIYKKSHVLYGLDLARKEIANSSRAVIVEGYTDVMACHLAGVTTAVATCGTAFGEDHVRVLRRFLDDRGGNQSEVIFTFDGDQAGQNAALKTFSLDQNFVSQTYVAVAPSGMDPCDLRLKSGDEAVRDLVDTRQPLYRFVLNNVLGRYDLDRADSRIDALREAAALVASVRDRSKVEAFSREIAQLVGVDMEMARAEVQRAARRGPESRQQPRQRDRQRPPETPGAENTPAPRLLPNLKDPRFGVEREFLKLVLQQPKSMASWVAEVAAEDFTHPVYRAVWERVLATGGPQAAAGDEHWAGKVHSGAGDVLVAAAVAELGVEALFTPGDPGDTYALAHVYRLRELSADRRIAELKSKLQRTDPTADQLEYNRIFGELVALEQHRRTLRERAVGAQ